MRKKRTLKKPVGKKVCSLVVDGETEKWYFQLKKDLEELPTIDIRPDLPVKKKLREQFEYVKEQANHADQVIWLVDFDTIIKEDRERKQGEKSKIKDETSSPFAPCPRRGQMSIASSIGKGAQRRMGS